MLWCFVIEKVDTELKEKGSIFLWPSLIGETPTKSGMFGPKRERVGISMKRSIQTLIDDL